MDSTHASALGKYRQSLDFPAAYNCIFSIFILALLLEFEFRQLVPLKNEVEPSERK
jgi:hypothetical protein